MSDKCKLVSPSNNDTWRSYHDIRRKILFENRGQMGAYNPNHPDEKVHNNHPKLLLVGDQLVGVVRIDMHDEVAILRRVAIDEPYQGMGFGRKLIELSEQFAAERGANRIESLVAPDAVEFYSKCGYQTSNEVSENRDVHMFKDL